VPFVSKATGVPWAKLAAKVMAGASMDELGVTEPPRPAQTSVKESVFPFTKFPGVDVVLGPEMRSTGEVMGVGANFGEAFSKAQLSAGMPLPEKGCVFISVNDHDKPAAVEVGKRLAEFGYTLVATRGTAAVLNAAGLRVRTIFKVNEGRPNAVDLMKAGSIQIVIYTPAGAHSFSDERAIRRTAIAYRVPCITTMSAAKAVAEALESRRRDPIRVWSLQEIHAGAKSPAAQGQ
jgi:carbamoyl-phosphate synthase large subunit